VNKRLRDWIFEHAGSNGTVEIRRTLITKDGHTEVFITVRLYVCHPKNPITEKDRIFTAMRVVNLDNERLRKDADIDQITDECIDSLAQKTIQIAEKWLKEISQ